MSYLCANDANDATHIIVPDAGRPYFLCIGCATAIAPMNARNRRISLALDYVATVRFVTDATDEALARAFGDSPAATRADVTFPGTDKPYKACERCGRYHAAPGCSL